MTAQWMSDGDVTSTRWPDRCTPPEGSHCMCLRGTSRSKQSGLLKRHAIQKPNRRTPSKKNHRNCMMARTDEQQQLKQALLDPQTTLKAAWFRVSTVSGWQYHTDMPEHETYRAAYTLVTPPILFDRYVLTLLTLLAARFAPGCWPPTCSNTKWQVNPQKMS